MKTPLGLAYIPAHAPDVGLRFRNMNELAFKGTFPCRTKINHFPPATVRLDRAPNLFLCHEAF